MAYLLNPVATERAVWMIEHQNRITFRVLAGATKTQIKQETEKKFAVQVKSVNTRNQPDGQRIASITFSKAGTATSLASRLKIL
jgi:large subunit ribosomal protein L23